MDQQYDLIVVPYGSCLLQRRYSVRVKGGLLELVYQISLPEMVCGSLQKIPCKYRILTSSMNNVWVVDSAASNSSSTNCFAHILALCFGSTKLPREQMKKIA